VLFCTIISVIKSDGVVEGGTGNLVKKEVATTKDVVASGKTLGQ
jgi:hypothetical protein